MVGIWSLKILTLVLPYCLCIEEISIRYSNQSSYLEVIYETLLVCISAIL